MSLTIVDPILVTDALLVSTDVPEADYPEWAVGTAYAKGDRVMVAAVHRVYQASQANTGKSPTDPANADSWVEVGATNRWKCLDSSNSSQTVKAGGMQYQVALGQSVNCAALLNVGGPGLQARVQMFDPAGPFRTNLFWYSGQFDNAYWAKTRATVVAAPSGGRNWYKLVEDTTAANNHYLGKVAGLGLVAGKPYVVSASAKPGERTVMGMTLFGLAGAECTFDLVAGTVLTKGAAVAAASIQPDGEGYRVSATWNFTGTGSGFIIYPLNAAGGTAVYTGDGASGFYLCDAQLEQAATSSTYIPTAGAAVTVQDPVYDSGWRSFAGSIPTADWYSYFFAVVQPTTQLILDDLPPYAAATIQTDLTVASGDAELGVMLFGYQLSYGSGISYGASGGIQDYSVKSTNVFGDTVLVQRAFSRRRDWSFLIENTELDGLEALLIQLRAKPVLWIGSDKYAFMSVYGFYKDFTITISYPDASECVLSIEGMT